MSTDLYRQPPCPCGNTKPPKVRSVHLEASACESFAAPCPRCGARHDWTPWLRSRARDLLTRSPAFRVWPVERVAAAARYFKARSKAPAGMPLPSWWRLYTACARFRGLSRSTGQTKPRSLADDVMREMVAYLNAAPVTVWGCEEVKAVTEVLLTTIASASALHQVPAPAEPVEAACPSS